MYLPLRQTGDYSRIDIVVRGELPPEMVAAAVGAALAPIEPNLARSEWRTLVLLAVALLAGYLPARRASRLDPLLALRAD